MYSLRIGGRSAAHTNIHPKRSPASHAFNCSARVPPLPWRSKKEYCRADSSSFRIGVLSLCYTHTHTHPYAYTSFERWRRVPSSAIPDVTAAPAYVYSRIFEFLSPPHPPQDLFPRLSTTSLTIAFTLALLTSTVTLRQHRIPIPLLA